MLLLGVALVAVMAVASACDIASLPEEQKALGQRLCALESEMHVVQRVMQELLQRVDITVDSKEVPAAQPEKRKNEFIRFGKRSADGEMEKRKNEFIRFGKRKNEFIRFGRSLPEMAESEMEKRKNEFIRFG